MGLKVLPIPVHKVYIDCDLVKVTGGLIESGFEESSTVVPEVTSSCVILCAMAKAMLCRSQKARHCSTGRGGRGGRGGGGFDGGRGGGGFDGGRGGSGSRGRGRGKEMFCYRCGDQGHLARDCDQTEDVCYNCNKPGHMARDCGHANDRRCYSCGGLGHIQRRCEKVVYCN
ncbi:cellular nucleic acid-binding protein-like [Trematomus bernacchii]|uniref:cellular nucleic acid-binding protein-like n=1 Tax=Trematomus bernacchii TaxID=40690 RepID=UPI00146A5CDE|nr:cellular nucleic acid-binding protein-like [Trematomus bernacchii]